MRDKDQSGKFGTFIPQAYKGYLISFNNLRNEYYVTKDKAYICTTLTITQAKKEIDGLSYSTNPAPRIGTAKPRRVSQATGKKPTKRLIARRTVNVKKGFFPNPAQRGSAKPNPKPLNSKVKQQCLTDYAQHIEAFHTSKDKLIRQAHLSYCEGVMNTMHRAGLLTNEEHVLLRDGLRIKMQQ